MSLDHHNYEYDGGSPDLPYAVGDRYYGQDMARDFQHVRDIAGKIMRDLFQDFPIYMNGGFVTQGVGDTLDITPAVGYVEFNVKVPDSFASLPPTVKTETITIRVESTQQTNMAVSSATLDGATTNYVKLAYDETDGSSRNRAKKAGSYNYEQARGFSITVDAVAPTDDEVLVATFIGSGGGTWTITNMEPDSVKAFGASEGFMRVKFGEAVTATDPVGVAKGNSDESIAFKCKHRQSFSPTIVDGGQADVGYPQIIAMDDPNQWLICFLDSANDLWWSVWEWDIEAGTFTTTLAPANSGQATNGGGTFQVSKLTGSTADRFVLGFTNAGGGSYRMRAFLWNGSALSFFGGIQTAASTGTYINTRITTWGADYFCVAAEESTGGNIEARVGHYVVNTPSWDTASTSILGGTRTALSLRAIRFEDDTDVALVFITDDAGAGKAETVHFDGTTIAAPTTGATIYSGPIAPIPNPEAVGKTVYTLSRAAANELRIFAISPLRAIAASGRSGVLSNRITQEMGYMIAGADFRQGTLFYIGDNMFVAGTWADDAGDRIYALVLKIVGHSLISMIDIFPRLDDGTFAVLIAEGGDGLNGAYIIGWSDANNDRNATGMIMPAFKGFPIQSYSAGEYGIIKTAGRVSGFSGLRDSENIGVDYTTGELYERSCENTIGIAEGSDVIKLINGAL